MADLILYPHNTAALDRIVESYENGERVAGILNATGTGKTYIYLALAKKNPSKKVLVILPSEAIMEYQNNLTVKYGISNVSFLTYQSLINMSNYDLEHLRFDYLVLEEFHHIGAPVWGSRVENLIYSHKFANILGLSAYSVRDRNTAYERDMAEDNGDEIFSDKIVYRYPLEDAISDGILPEPIYVGQHIITIEQIEWLSKRIKDNDPNRKKYLKILNEAKKTINLEESSKKLILDNIKPNSKVIYFCPFMSNKNKNDIDTIISNVRQMLLDNGYGEDDFVLYKSVYKDKNSPKNRLDFYNDCDSEGKDVSNKLRIMFCVNQYNEGLHVPNVDTVILGRDTTSDIVFFEQIGRCLSIREDGVSPKIIDLVDNYSSMLKLEDKITHMHRKKREYPLKGNSSYVVSDHKLDVRFENQDLFELLEAIKSNIVIYSFDEAFELASNYYERYKNLKVPSSFRTIDGISENIEYGYPLGAWLIRLRVDYKNGSLDKDKIDKLNSIGMVWQVKKSWDDSYNLAKEYYDANNHLNIKSTFIYKGYALGQWLANQRSKYHKGILSFKKIKKLQSIGIEWSHFNTWEESYSLLVNYYNHYGNSNVPWNFKTSNGIDYDPVGYNLYSWLKNQKDKKYNNALDKDKEDLLNLLDVVWIVNKRDKKISTDQYFELLSNYYNNFGNLDIKRGFKTKDGINECEDGYDLGAHVSRLRLKKKANKLSIDEIDRYNSIGMIWTIQTKKNLTWDEFYDLAKLYYIKYEHLNVPSDFKTFNGFDAECGGYDLGNWIYLQRKNKADLDKKKIDKLDVIDMIWSPRKDIDRIIKLLEKHNVNWIIYSKIIFNIPYLELLAKVNFLIDRDELIEIDNHLNPIFMMSEDMLIDKYNITKEELISKYSKKKGKVK